MPIPDLSQSPRLEESFETEGELHHLEFLRPAKPWRRMLAFFIDFSLIHACSLFLGRWTAILMLRYLISPESAGAMGDMEFAGVYQYAILLTWPLYLLFIGYGYYLVFLSNWGTTIGKGVLGIEVINRSGLRPDAWAISKRYFLSLINVATWGVTFYMMAYRPDGRCVQDRGTGTSVRRRIKSSVKPVISSDFGPLETLDPAPKDCGSITTKSA